MKNMMMKLAARGSAWIIAVMLLANLITPAFAQDTLKIWTAAASTGAVDEADYAQVVFTGSLATLTPAPAESQATIRYNVTAVDGLFANLTPTSWPALIVRYRDNGANARVVARLREHILNGPQEGQTNTLITFDSDLHPSSGGFQTRAIGDCGVFPQFQFATPQIVRVYFVEVELSKTGTVGNPGLAGLAISRYGVCQNVTITQ